MGTAKDEKSQSDRPNSRSGIAGRIPFMRSESYTGVSTSSDAVGNEGSSKVESLTKRGRLSSIGASLTRSSSSLALPTSDTSSLTGTDYTGSDKGGNWASNLLTRKKEGPYKAMSGEEQESIMFDSHQRGLSHVKEISTESRSNMDDDVLLTNGFQQRHTHSSSSDAAWPRQNEVSSHTRITPPDDVEGHQNVIIHTTDEGNSNPNSPSVLKPWEKFEGRRDSLGIGLQLTGNTTASSEGGNPFGHDGGELSPMGTGTGFSPLPRKNRIGSIGEPWSQDDAEEDDPADGLLGDPGKGTIRRSAKR